MTSLPLLVIAGPTATGKTAAAMALAEHFGGELVGADSVQVYRGFDIGSAKPTAAELGTIRHHLIDVIDPDEEIDAGAYAALADRAIEEVHARSRLPIVVGGTGLWIRAVVRGLVDVPPVDPDLMGRGTCRPIPIHAPTPVRGSSWAISVCVFRGNPVGGQLLHRDPIDLAGGI